MRYLWWASKKMDKEIIIQTLVHIFGAGSSPAIANYVLRYHAEVIKDKYSLSGFITIIMCMYVLVCQFTEGLLIASPTSGGMGGRILRHRFYFFQFHPSSFFLARKTVLALYVIPPRFRHFDFHDHCIIIHWHSG